MAKSAVDVIGDAFEHTRKQLLEPFRFGQWARLALLALATGELSSGGSCRGVGNILSKTTHGSQSFSFAQSSFPNPRDILHGIDPALIASIILILLMGGLVLMVAWIYVSSITRFMLFEAVLRKNCDSLGAGWNRWQGPGMRYFWWQLALSIVGVSVAAVLFIPLLLPILATMRNHQQPGREVFLAFLPMVFVFIVFGLVMALINVLTKDFVVPMMALDGVGVLEGWRCSRVSSTRLTIWVFQAPCSERRTAIRGPERAPVSPANFFRWRCSTTGSISARTAAESIPATMGRHGR